MKDTTRAPVGHFTKDLAYGIHEQFLAWPQHWHSLQTQAVRERAAIGVQYSYCLGLCAMARLCMIHPFGLSRREWMNVAFRQLHLPERAVADLEMHRRNPQTDGDLEISGNCRMFGFVAQNVGCKFSWT